MKEHTIALKYGAEDHPDFVYTNEEMDINITFSFLDCRTNWNRYFEKYNMVKWNKISKKCNTDIAIEKAILNHQTEFITCHTILFPLQIENDAILEVIFLFFDKSQLTG